MIMVISIFFRDEVQGWESKNLSFDSLSYTRSKRRDLIKLGCHCDIFGNSAISRNIDLFLDSDNVKEYRFDCTGQGYYYYVIRKEKDF